MCAPQRQTPPYWPHCSFAFLGSLHPPPQVILACFFSPQTSFPLLHLAGDLAIDLVTGKIKAIRRASSHVPTTLQLFSTGQLGSPPPTAHGTPLQGTLAMPGDCSGCQAVTWRGRCSWHLVGGGQDAAQHPIVHGAGLTAERSSPNQCQWCWGCETHTAPPSGLPLDPGALRTHPQQCFSLRPHSSACPQAPSPILTKTPSPPTPAKL